MTGRRWAAATAGLLCMLLPLGLSTWWINRADDRLGQLEAADITDAEHPQAVAVARAANEDYCTPPLQRVLRRVLLSCGLIGGSGGRGCQPAEARTVATMAGGDFNALFLPMQDRGGIVQFEQGSAALDPADTALIDRAFADRRGASYFFVVARASQDGATERNNELSRERAEAVMTHLADTFDDQTLEREVGLLWLGEEYAQLDPSFCGWSRSGEAAQCELEDLNRSAFFAWIDCRL